MSAAVYYVLGGCSGGSPWVLQFDPCTEQQCIGKIRWQRVGQGQFDPPDYWQICRFDPDMNGFVSMDARLFQPTRAPYTEEAWAKFCHGIGYKAPDLKETA